MLLIAPSQHTQKDAAAPGEACLLLDQIKREKGVW